MRLEKATLQEISSDQRAQPKGPPIPVQFNPNSLRMQMTNEVEGGRARGRQARQYIGTSSTTLTLELVFDTADEGSTGAPVSVRKKTALVEQFVLPKGSARKKQTPPKVRFHWGDLTVDGVVESLGIDLDHFAANGTPLRAKLNLTIREQNPLLQYLAAGAGANPATNPPAPGRPALGARGTEGTGTGSQSAAALGGESLSDFAARVGADASAWRAMAAGVDNPLSLEAGAEIRFDVGVAAGAGMGVSAGVQAGASASLEASLGLEPSAALSAVAGVGVNAEMAAGFALAASGGVSAALETAQIARTQAAEQQTRQSFGVAASDSTGAAAATAASGALSAPATPRPAPPEQPRTPLSQSGLPTPSEQHAARPAPAHPRADPRSASFGRGVPLRPAVGKAVAKGQARPGKDPRRDGRTEANDPPTTHDPTVPPWVALPSSPEESASAQTSSGSSRCACAPRPRRPRGGT